MSSRSSKQPKPAILDWAPAEPLADETPAEHIRNGLQALYELEVLLQSSGDFTSDRRTALALAKRRLGWALATLERIPRLPLSPLTGEHNGCPVCGEPLTVAVRDYYHAVACLGHGWCGTCQSYR